MYTNVAVQVCVLLVMETIVGVIQGEDKSISKPH